MPDERRFQIRITGDASDLARAGRQGADALKETTTATTQATEQTKNLGKASKEAGDTIVKETGKATVAKKDFKAAIKGVKEEFPELAHYGKLALNPITALVFGVAAGFAIFSARVKEATRAMAGFELPDLTPERIGRISEAATAWKKYSEAMQDTIERYNTLEAVSGRVLSAMEAESKAKKQMADSDKALELARLQQRADDRDLDFIILNIDISSP